MTRPPIPKYPQPVETSRRRQPNRQSEQTPDTELFRADAIGLHVRTEDGSYRHVCSPLRRIGYTTDLDGGNPAHNIQITTLAGLKRIEIAETLLAQPNELKLTLLGAGLQLADTKDVVKDIASYLKSFPHVPLYKRIKADGWINADCSGGYAFGETLYGSASETTVVRPTDQQQRFQRAGDIETWRASTQLWKDNPHLIAVSCFALAAPLIRPMGHSNFCVSIVGPSSTGKTTALRLARALTTTPRALPTWAGTANGLVAAALEHNDLPFVLDEIGQTDAHNLDQLLYDLTCGITKHRADTTGNAAASSSISTVIISAGEESIFDRLKRGGKTPTGGHVARFVTLAVDGPRGIVSDLHGSADSGTFISDFRNELGRTHGVAWPQFIKYVAAQTDDLKNEYQKLRPRIRSALISGSDFDKTDNICSRVLDHFSIATFAGFIGVRAGIVELSKEEIGVALRKCFKEWLGNYQTSKPASVTLIMDRIQKLILKNKDDIFLFRDYRKYEASSPFGYLHHSDKLGETLILIRPLYFDDSKEKYGPQLLHEALRLSGCLVTGSDERPTKQVKVPGGRGEKFNAYVLRETVILTYGGASGFI